MIDPTALSEHAGISDGITRDDVLQALSDSSGGFPSVPPPNIWVENTKSVHQHGGQGWEFGKCLWSPSRSSHGKDWYGVMRRVAPGDLIIHLCDTMLTGV